MIPHVCTCDTGYAGQDCENCTSNYRMVDDECIPCPTCYNGGTCNEQAQCNCPSNYGGPTCRVCSEGYFGYACKALPYISKTIPSDAIDIGDTVVRISGYNLGNANSTVQCQFGYNIPRVDAEVVSDHELKCTTPAVTLSGSGSLFTYIRVIVDSVYSYNSVPFSFYGLCPEDQCEQGFCSFGSCVVSNLTSSLAFLSPSHLFQSIANTQCYYGYRGDTCNETLVPPIIADPAIVFELTELETFTYQLELEQGSQPVEWSLLGLPVEGMSVNASTGLLLWSSPEARSSIYQIQVQATNEMTRNAVMLELHVSPSYFVETSTTKELSYIRPAPPLEFYFVTRDMATKQPVGNKVAVLWVHEKGSSPNQRRKIIVKTNALGFFTALYQPYSTDFGEFVYGGEHPTYTNLTNQGQVNIMGMNVNRRYYNVSGHPDELQTIDNAFAFQFKGGNFTGINATFDHVADVEINNSLSSTTANFENNTVTMSLNLTAFAAIRGRIYFTVYTAEGVVVSSSYLYLDMRYRTPKLSVSPHILDIKIANGASAQYYDVTLQNIGSLKSSVIEVSVPAAQQDVIITPTTDYVSSLSVDETADISFKVSLPGEVAVGNTYYGTIGKIIAVSVFTSILISSNTYHIVL